MLAISLRLNAEYSTCRGPCPVYDESANAGWELSPLGRGGPEEALHTLLLETLYTTLEATLGDTSLLGASIADIPAILDPTDLEAGGTLGRIGIPAES
jgi:hypothetical protein